jgi:hypothetical protein
MTDHPIDAEQIYGNEEAVGERFLLPGVSHNNVLSQPSTGSAAGSRQERVNPSTAYTKY